MWISRLFVTGVALVLIVILFLLPKVVVDNKEQENAEAIGQPSDTQLSASHDRQLSESELSEISHLKQRINADLLPKKSATFADSLAGLFASFNYLDSAAYYYGQAADKEPDMERWLKAGDGYFEAYSFAVEVQKQDQLGKNARKYFNLALEQDPGMYDVKAKVALTFLPEQPMQAVLLLREVVDNEPENELGLYNLGLLSIQSQQFGKAVERFEKLTQSHPEHLEGQFYLGVSYFEAGEKTKARDQFELIKTMDQEPEVLAAVDEYLEKLK